jgi:hypothetical protein
MEVPATTGWSFPSDDACSEVAGISVVSGSLRYVTVLIDFVDRGNFETNPGAAIISLPVSNSQPPHHNKQTGQEEYIPADSKYYNPKSPPPRDSHTNPQTQDHN